MQLKSQAPAFDNIYPFLSISNTKIESMTVDFGWNNTPSPNFSPNFLLFILQFYIIFYIVKIKYCILCSGSAVSCWNFPFPYFWCRKWINTRNISLLISLAIQNILHINNLNRSQYYHVSSGLNFFQTFRNQIGYALTNFFRWTRYFCSFAIIFNSNFRMQIILKFYLYFLKVIINNFFLKKNLKLYLLDQKSANF